MIALPIASMITRAITLLGVLVSLMPCRLAARLGAPLLPRFGAFGALRGFLGVLGGGVG